MTTKLKTHYGELDLELCPSNEGEDFGVIAHKSLTNIFDVVLRGKFAGTFEVVKFDKTHSLVKCIIKDLETNFTVEELGEKVRVSGEGDIAQQFPVTSAYVRAFDRAMIRILGLEGKFYSDEELSNGKVRTTVPGSSFNPEDLDVPVDSGEIIAPEGIFNEEDTIIDETPVETYTPDYSSMAEEPIESDFVPIDEPDDEPEVVEDNPETTSDANDPGNFVLPTGKHIGKTIREIYKNNSKETKDYLDYVLGGKFTKNDMLNGVIAFYLYEGLVPAEGTTENSKRALERFEKISKEIKGA